VPQDHAKRRLRPVFTEPKITRATAVGLSGSRFVCLPMEAEDALDIARALASAHRTPDPALEAAWAAALQDLPGANAWAIQQPHGHPELIILTAHCICRVTATKRSRSRAGAPGLVTDRYRIDDSIRFFSRPGEWTLSFSRIEVAILLKDRPVPAGQEPGRVRALVRAIWEALPAASKGTQPPPRA
jgi:hypothetical protein